MAWKSKIVIGLTFLLLGFFFGIYYGGFLTGLLTAPILSFVLGLGIGQVTDWLGLLREWYKDRKEAQRVPKIEYECLVEEAEAHNCSAISQRVGQEGNIVSIRIANSGLGTAYRSSGRMDFEMEISPNKFGIISRDQTLNWRHFDIGQDTEHTISMSPYQELGDAIQKYYATERNKDLIINKPEWLEICFTLKGHNIAYTLACDRKSKLQFGKRYQVKLQLTGNEIKEKQRAYLLDLRSWQDISFEEVPSAINVKD